jgi:hypothetical protein
VGAPWFSPTKAPSLVARREAAKFKLGIADGGLAAAAR